MLRITLTALAAIVLLQTAALAATPTPLLSTDRLYPYVGIEQRWTFIQEAPDQDDLVLSAGVAYSLGAIAPSVTWRWNPEPGTDVNEFVLGLRLNVRGLFK